MYFRREGNPWITLIYYKGVTERYPWVTLDLFYKGEIERNPRVILDVF